MMGIAQKVSRNFSDAVRSRGQSYFVKGRVIVMAAAARRGRGAGARDGEVPGAAAAAGLEAPGLVHLPVLQPPGRAVQAPLGDAAPGRLAEPAPGAAGVPAEAGRARPRRPPTSGLPEIRDASGAATAAVSRRLGAGDHRAGPPRPSARPGPASRRDPAADQGPRHARRADRASRGLEPAGPVAARTAGPSSSRRPAPGAGTGTGPAPAAAKAVNRNAKRLLVYVLDVAATLAQNQVVIDLARRQRKTTGDWGPLRPWYYAPGPPHVKYDPEDRLILALLDEAQGNASHAGSGSASQGVASGHAAGTGHGPLALPGHAMGAESTNGAGRRPAPAYSSAAARAAAERALRGTRRFVLRKDQAALVERLARTGRLRLRRTEGEDDPPTVRWDDGQPWRFALDVRAELGGKRWAWRGSLRRGDATAWTSPSPWCSLPGPLDPGRRPRRAVRRRGRHALDRPAPPREGDRLRRAAAGPHARPDPGRDPGAARRSWSRRSTSRRSTPSRGPA